MECLKWRERQDIVRPRRGHALRMKEGMYRRGTLLCKRMNYMLTNYCLPRTLSCNHCNVRLSLHDMIILFRTDIKYDLQLQSI
ncbi:hypothetical protein KC19_11G107700 [Ceratodon purpureus]|uniref:Uncharacterized protein n=1 Tax=Ceratodon purpureus TaxID=3225 RepID=A0A8T0GDR9_CERPU|nr:hypothetical protein KC19_11G107700 [Ceratodon purpureus]